MTGPNCNIHILDRDVKRRAAIAYGLAQHDRYRAQIYEDLGEVVSFPPRDGFLLLADSFTDEMPSVTKIVASSASRVPVIVFGEHPATETVVQAMLAGAVDYLEWPFDVTSFDRSIARAEEDRTSQPRSIERRQNAMARLESLTDREREVLRNLIRGLSSKDIGATLDISPRTVEVHRASLIGKLSARSTSDAVRIGIYGGLDD